jgi:Tfp pilus assembly protein PilF
MDRTPEALEELRRAMELDETNDRYAYVYAVALHSTGDPAGAIDLLADYVAKYSGGPELLLALVTFNRDAGDMASALRYAEQLLELSPGDPQIGRLVEELRQNQP